MSDGRPKRQRPVPEPAFYAVEAWGPANSIGVNRVYEDMRIEGDACPHIQIGTNKLVDNELAIDWYRRHYGVNTGGAS